MAFHHYALRKNLMAKRHLLISFFIIIWLAACSPALEPAGQPTPGVPATTAATPTTAAPTATTGQPTAVKPTATAVPEVDPYALAHQILEQAVLPESESWQVQLCEGEAAVLCVSQAEKNVGFAELLIFSLTGFSEEDPIRLAAGQLAADLPAASLTGQSAAREALQAHATEYLAAIAADRAITFPEDPFIPLDVEPVQLGALPALAYGFVRTNSAGEIQERYLNVAAFDNQFIYLIGINYDPANVSTFISDTAVTQFAPLFYEIAAALPIQAQAKTTLPILPELVPAISLSGYFPENVVWSLATELPAWATAVAVLSQPAQSEPLSAEQAAATAQTYGFSGPLYVEYRTGFTMDELTDMGMFIVFDGARNLNMWSRPYFYSDARHRSTAADLPFAQAAQIAEQYLKENGWLTFPYETRESDQGEGVLFLPLIEGVLLSSPAYAVRVAADGGIASIFIYPLDDIAEIGSYPIVTAETAWQQLQENPNLPGNFYMIDPPPMDTPMTLPATYQRLPAPGESSTVYNNIWVYRPLSGAELPIVTSNDYHRIHGEPALIEALTAETDYLVKLSGFVEEPAPGLRSLSLTDWELVPDAGGLPMFFGQIAKEGEQIYLVDTANQITYLLPDAPAELAPGDETVVAGMPDAVDEITLLHWQEISVYPPQEETIFPTPTGPMKAVTIDSVKLVYLRMPAHVSGRTDNLYFPVWQFMGEADNGERVTMWVTAVSPEYLQSPLP